MRKAGKSEGAAAGGLFERIWCALALCFGLLMLALVVATPLEVKHQAALGAAGFVAALLLARRKSRFSAIVMVALSVAASARYLFWRFTATLPDDPFADLLAAGLLIFAETYACVMLALGYFQSIHPIDRKPTPLPEHPGTWPTVDVFIPTLDEPLAVVRATVLAAKALDWPAHKLNVYLLDDGRRDAFRAFAAQAGVGYLARPDRAHAKAGNLNHALARTRGELVAVFDCDHVPTRSFLQATVGLLVGQRNVAVVQTPQHFYSPDPFERNLRTFRRVPGESALFHGLIQRTNDLWNASTFTGSCAVLRRSALEAIGGFATGTVTEDAHTSLRLHRKGQTIAYLPLPLAAGLATESLAAHVRQRVRWARGLAQLLRLENPLLGRGLTLAQRLCYVASILHFLHGLPRLVLLTAPIGYLAFDLHVIEALPIAVLAHWLPHVLHAVVTSSRLQGGLRHTFWSEIYETCLAAYLVVPTTLALLRPRAVAFAATPKGGKNGKLFFDRRTAMPWITLGLVNLTALGFGAWRLGADRGAADVAGINVAWALYNLAVLACTAAVAWEARQVRTKHRVQVEMQAMLRHDDGRTLRCTTRDLSLAGARLHTSGDRMLPRGERLHLSLFAGTEELPLPLEVVHHDAASLRVRFRALTIEEESHLVRTIFSRADAWLGWRAATKDRPLRTWLLFLAKGIGAGLRFFVPRRAQPGGAA